MELRINKLFICMTLILSVLGSGVCTCSFAEDSQTEETQIEEAQAEVNEDVLEYKSVIDLLCGEELLEDSDEITRETFVVSLAKLVKAGGVEPDEFYFSDVTSFVNNYKYIYEAAQRNWISKSDKFNGSRAISYAEALKIAVSMLGYDSTAEWLGGYPGGYLSVAGTLDLNEDMRVKDDKLTSMDVYTLFYNVITTKLPELGISHQSITVQYGKETDDLLYELYGVREIEGIINETPYNSMYDADGDAGKDHISIDGETYLYEDAEWDMLAKKVRAYVHYEKNEDFEGEVIYLRDLSKQKALSLKDINDKKGNKVTYYLDNGSSKRTVSLNDSCTVIVNGKLKTEDIDSEFTDNIGDIVFINNNNDSAYDTVYINKYSYMTVGRIDYAEEQIADKFTADTLIDYSDMTCIVYKDGERMGIRDIDVGERYRVIKSYDNQFAVMFKLRETMTGTIESISDDKVIINGSEYYVSEYFTLANPKLLKPGTESVFSVDGDVLVYANTNSTDMQYGYFLQCWEEYDGESVRIKVYTASGDFERYNVRKRPIIDGRAVKSNDVVKGMFNDTPQLIRYRLNDEGEVAYIDFSTDELPEKAGIYPDKNDSLTRFSHISQKAVRFRNGYFLAWCNAKNAIVFSIPNDITKTDLFSVKLGSTLRHDSEYIGDFYDIDEYGQLGAMVYKTDTPYQIDRTPIPMVIKSVLRAVNSEGEVGYEVYGYHDGSFKTYFMSDDVIVTKKATVGTTVKSGHSLLSGGDVVTIAVDGDEIKLLNVIFDSREGVCESNVNAYNKDQAQTEMYFGGLVYSCSSSANTMCLAIEENAGGGYNMSPDALRCVNTTNNKIVRYDMRTSELRPVTVDEIKTYNIFGSQADFAIVTQDAFATKAIVLLDNLDYRRDK